MLVVFYEPQGKPREPVELSSLEKSDTTNKIYSDKFQHLQVLGQTTNNGQPRAASSDDVNAINDNVVHINVIDDYMD